MLPSIVEQPAVTSDLALAEARFPRIWQAWDALCWLLARNRGIGVQLSSVPPPWYLYQMPSAALGTPDLIVGYTDEGPTLTIQSVLIC
jgi:hypothetical protein